MFKTTLFSVLLLALAMQSVNGKPACGCENSRTPPPSTLPPCQPATPEPCAKQEVRTSSAFVITTALRVPCIEQATPSTTTTTTTKHFAQHGFLRGRSTMSNLVLCSEFLSAHMSEPSQVDVIYTDYSKCFDRIDHIILLQKLQQSPGVCIPSLEPLL
ncbi:PREDICTED: uncharacterized protein LOC106123800 [Papilio xuthus]|uniref:Uncharacterized protein LOC106123800 n=1 Tax=Papilio xuthus TaxID=66420 RepID=A0AAJ7EFN5_PAPXU|nr:PREDICTED: uncharacterized protein LOC106123800 [Papilio xuthus]